MCVHFFGCAQLGRCTFIRGEGLLYFRSCPRALPIGKCKVCQAISGLNRFHLKGRLAKEGSVEAGEAECTVSRGQEGQAPKDTDNINRDSPPLIRGWREITVAMSKTKGGSAASGRFCFSQPVICTGAAPILNNALPPI